MSVDIKKDANFDMKSALENWNLDGAFAWIESKIEETMVFKWDLNRIWLKVMTCQIWERWEDFTSWIDKILAQYLQQNNIA